MVSTTFYVLAFISVFNIAMSWVLLNARGVNGLSTLPTWVPSLMLFVVGVLTLFIGYMFENYTIHKKKHTKK